MQENFNTKCSSFNYQTKYAAGIAATTIATASAAATTTTTMSSTVTTKTTIPLTTAPLPPTTTATTGMVGTGPGPSRASGTPTEKKPSS